MVFLFPYAYDRMPNGKPREGVPENHLGSKARCDSLISKYKALAGRPGETCEFIFTAGYTKEQKEEPEHDSDLRLANQMITYIRRINPRMPGFTSHIRAWGTFEETRVAIDEIKEVCDQHDNVMVYASTNLGHMPRVWLCWLFLKPKSWKVHFVLARHSFTPKEWFQETSKFFQYLYRFLFRKW